LTVALVNNVVAGAVVGLFGLVFSAVRSVSHATVDKPTMTYNATKGRVNRMGTFSRLMVTV
jgi:hypothetical protein